MANFIMAHSDSSSGVQAYAVQTFTCHELLGYNLHIQGSAYHIHCELYKGGNTF